MIDFSGVTAGYGETPVLDGLSLHIPAGKVTALVGPNGSGKTTLLRVAARQLHPLAGAVLLAGKPLEAYGRRELARTAAFLPQVRAVPAITVKGLVSHGRFPHLGLSRKMRPADREAVACAMEDCGVTRWQNRDLRELSGGERQRAYLAMALAQDTRVVFLDEPTTYLDIAHQFAVMELTRTLRERGKTVVMVLHELPLALQYADELAVLTAGRVVCHGAPEAVFSAGALDGAFGVKAHRAEGGWYFTAQ